MPAASPRDQYLTSPPPTAEMPRGIPYIVGNEAAERFSYYGMRAILYVFMTEHLVSAAGQPDLLDKATATQWQHRFGFGVYFLPIAGALLADWLWGKYKTILRLSLMYCLGHALLALVDVPGVTGIAPRSLLVAALVCLAIGAGGIKPCVSAHVGDQFGKLNQHLLPRVYQWFYFAINVGAAASMVLTPRLLANFGPGVAFGVPGVLMGGATFVFWLGRNKFVHIPPTGNRIFAEIASPAGRRAVANLLPLYAFVVMFFALFEQTQSTWIEQAKNMDRVVSLPGYGAFEFNPAEIQAINSVFVLMMIPIFAGAIYPLWGRFAEVTPLKKIGVGLFVTAGSFAVCGYVQARIDAGDSPHIGWQVLAYLIITAGEVLVSITALEFSYTQAPKTLKSFIMGLFLLAIALGNLLTSEVAGQIKALEEAGYRFLTGANYYWTFTAAMLASAAAFVVWSQFYRGATFIQGSDAATAE
ncbi:MAG: POT family MFS transporter [Pirellulales bacterium]|nr:POT family MFS transporter [Pirellulales bacterium]